jgi:2-keto-4-pentenoate hydratase/2-oxohepta-3-ene-1,7-dioic acid hydratase in catechol pathway
MRFLRVEYQHAPVYCALRDELTLERWSAAPWLGGSATGEQIARPDTRLLVPVTPSKIVCVGRNYAAHAKELGNDVPSEPLLFLKPPSSLLAHGEAIVLPPQSTRVEHEAEIGVVIGQRLRNASPAEARAAIFGFTCLNDVTARDLQRRDVQFTRGKGFDSFCPVGPWIETELDPSDLTIVGRVNAGERQRGHTRDMVFPIVELIAFISAVMTLEPGDLIASGTPEGVGPLAAGDVVEVELEGLGTLINPVEAPSTAGR